MMGVPGGKKNDEGRQTVIGCIKEGFTYVFSRPVLLILFLLVLGINFLVLGPLMVGIPVLANTRLVEGAAAYGIIMSAFGGGALLGIILAGVLPTSQPEHFSGT